VVEGVTLRLVILVYRMEVRGEEFGRPVEYVVLSGMRILVVLVCDREIELGIPVECPVLKGILIPKLLVMKDEECVVVWK